MFFNLFLLLTTITNGSETHVRVGVTMQILNQVKDELVGYIISNL